MEGMTEKGNGGGTLMDFFQEDAAFSLCVSGDPFVREDERDISLHFGLDATQSKMRKSDPVKLLLGYTRAMMGFLLFQPKPERIAMIGLGGGSLAKYCLRHLSDIHFTAVEINSGVIALRDKFEIPPDGPNFKVLCGDGAAYVRDHKELVDVLLVDGYDREGQPKQLSSAGFYDHCYEKLRDGGVLVVNLMCFDIKYGTYCARIRESFENQVVVVEPDDWGNRVAFAYKGKAFPPSADELAARTLNLLHLHAVSLHDTAQKIIKGINRRKKVIEE